VPVSIVMKHGVEDNEELAHTGGERGLGVLTVGTQSQIESSDGGIAANPRHCRHIQDAPDLSAPTPDTTAAAQFSGRRERDRLLVRCAPACRSRAG
jgi:hypothetical protein